MAYLGNPSGCVVIAVPGPWTALEEVGAALAAGRSGLTLAGERLMDGRTVLATLRLRAAEPDRVQAFREANADACLTEVDLEHVAGQRWMLDAVHGQPSFEVAHQVLRVGAALCDAGGPAVKVESAGLAHSARHWRALAAEGAPSDLYHALVRLVPDGSGGRSCGMHAFGLPDALARSTAPTGAQPRGEAMALLLHSFNAYMLLETPDLADGDTFSPDEWSPWYRVVHRPDSFHLPDNACYNPYGVWELVLQPN